MTDSKDTQIQEDDDREDSRRLSLQGNRPPAEIDGYTFIRRLGTGAYGTVWLAREDHTGRVVAIKYYPHRRGLNWSLLSREVEKLATLYTSRNIVRLLDVGWNAEPPYYVMEYVENGSLGDLLDGGPLDVHQAVRIAREVCLALIEAHGAGVLHCDLKPDNVLLDSQYQVRLCDFGQSRMSHERSPALGTLYYMAPEQADLDAVADARWDVYAVGALLYHMLTGEPPCRTPELQQQLESADALADRLVAYRTALRNASPPVKHRQVKGVDGRLAATIDSCLAADPAERLPNAQAILAELDARERNRARRPLLLLGLLGPVLLIAAMVPIFLNALQNNLDRMEDGLTARALAHDAMSARIQARALQRELADRVEELERVIQRDEFREALEVLSRTPPEELAALTAAFHDPSRDSRRPLAERPTWMRLLDTAHQNAVDSNEALERSADTSWFLQDATGTQVWRLPFNPRSIGQNYSWRDYFHGRGFEYSRDSVPDNVVPIRSSWVSIPFKSEATGRYMVAMATPVRNRENRVIGVFARTIHLGDLQSRLGQTLRGSKTDPAHFIIALADQRTGQLLDHPWLTEEHLRANQKNLDGLYGQLQIGEPVEQTLEYYEDPVGRLDIPSAADYRGEWMAAMVPMESPQTPWLVIVQEKRADALQPVVDMTRNAKRTAWVAVGTSLTLMAIVWLFVWRALQKSGTSRSFATR